MTQPSRKPLERILGNNEESVAFSLADRTMSFLNRTGLLNWLQLKHDFVPRAVQTSITNAQANTLTVVGTGVDTLVPPTTGTLPGPNSGYYQVTGFTLGPQSTNAGFTLVNDALVMPDSGYYLADGWLNFRHSSNASTVAVIFGIEKASNPGVINFTPRPTALNVPNNNRLGLLSGGGPIPGVEAGDKVTVWVASDNSGTITIPNASLRVWKHSDL